MPLFIRPTALPIDPWPTPDRGYATCRVTSPYGERPGGFHAANDIGNGRLGDEIIAARAGKVILASNQPSPPWNYAAPADKQPYWGPSYGGNTTVIDHGNGEYSQYAHQRDMLVRAGQIVVRGQLIGHIGDSGSAAPPPHGGGGHLHFGIRFLRASTNGHNGWIDPWPLIAESAAVPANELISLPDTSAEEPMIDANTQRPVASVVFRGGTVYRDADRAKGVLTTLTGPYRLGIYARPTSPTQPDGKATLVPAYFTPGGKPAVGGVGYDQADWTTWQPLGWSVDPVIKEVPTGITQAQLDAAVAKAKTDATKAEKERIAVARGNAEAQTIRST